MLSLILVVVGILLSSGFFSGAEAALVNLSDADVESMVHKKRMGAKLVKRVEDDLSRAVIAIVIMNNVVNIVGSILVGQLVIDLYGNAVLAVTTTGLTFGVIIFSEIIPKTLGMHYDQRVSLLVAPPIWLLVRILSPVIFLLEFLTNIMKRGERKVGTEEQIRSLVTIGRREGHIESDEGQLIHRAFILNDKRAEDIMTPLKDIIGLEQSMTVAEAVEKADSSSHSRYPVFGSSIHEILGVIMLQDILRALAHGKGDENIGAFMRDPLVVTHVMRSDELISLFRDEHKHLAVVQQDDHTVGIVTLEDVLEELVGDIEDETDIED